MFRCDYCGTQFLEHQPNCPNCGAQIHAKVSTTDAKAGAIGAPKAIRKLCEPFDEEDSFYFDDSIDENRMKTVRERFKIPPDEKIWLLYDDTLLGTNREGFAICESGLYWRNTWTTSSKRTYLSWRDFASRSISLKSMEIKLGRGDNIGVAGAGDKKVMKAILELLLALQENVRGQQPAGS
jgi:DNA-directed RNA polymerase subunit RPC12/RpoP